MTKTFLAILVVSFLTISCSIKTQPPVKEEVSHYLSEETAKLNLPFSEAVRVGNMLYLSGQVGNKPGTLELVEGGIEAESKQVMENIKAILEANGTSFEHAVKLSVFIDDIEEWGAFNKVYVEYFPNKKPARSALGADGLALGAAVEVECIAFIPTE